jgi:hypothetical protein
VLWFVAVLALAMYGLSQTELWLYQTYFNWEFVRSLEISGRAARPEHPVPYTMQPLGRLEMPSIALSAIFIEGVDSYPRRRKRSRNPSKSRLHSLIE